MKIENMLFVSIFNIKYNYRNQYWNAYGIEEVRKDFIYFIFDAKPLVCYKKG
jgi:hypothetical protein